MLFRYCSFTQESLWSHHPACRDSTSCHCAIVPASVDRYQRQSTVRAVLALSDCTGTKHERITHVREDEKGSLSKEAVLRFGSNRSKMVI